MEVCNAHERASTTAALYEGESAAEIMKQLEDRFLNVEENTIQSEKTKFNTLAIQSNEIRLDRQAKTLETLGVPPAEAEKLTRIKERLTGKYSQLATACTQQLTYPTLEPVA
jgi:Holliday junction resolvasome RuvABC DNA-binding subunit